MNAILEQVGNTENTQNTQTSQTPQLPEIEVEKQHYKFATLQSNPNISSALSDVINKVTQAGGIVKSNFDLNSGIPADRDLAIVPMNKTVNSQQFCYGILVESLPTIEDFTATSEGKDWVENLIHNQLMQIAVNSARQKKVDGEFVEQNVEIPYSVSDFTTSKRSTGGLLQAFNKYAKQLVNKYNQNQMFAIRGFNAKMLRACLESTAMANELFPNVKQVVWENGLKALLKACEQNNDQPGIIAEWVETRDSKGMPEMSSDVDLGDLDL